MPFSQDMLTVEEVPEIFDAVINSTPHLQMAVNDATMCISQLLEALTSCALTMYSRPPYGAKYATVSRRMNRLVCLMNRGSHVVRSGDIPGTLLRDYV